MKKLMVIFILINSLNLFAQSKSPSAGQISSKEVSNADFITSKNTRLKFYQDKINDYKKIHDCTLEAESFVSMDLCNKFIEKYMKKVQEEK
jgi:hypothetical protein